MTAHDVDYRKNHFFKKGLAALEKKNYGYALELFLEVLKLHPECYECYRHLWQAARAHRKQDSAGHKIRNLILAAGWSVQAYFNIVRRDIASAIIAQRHACLLLPDTISLLQQLATLFLHQQEPLAAQYIWEEIIHLEPNYLPALKQLLRLYFDAKHYVQAKTTAERILQIKAEDLDAETVLKNIAALGLLERGFDDMRPAE